MREVNYMVSQPEPNRDFLMQYLVQQRIVANTKGKRLRLHLKKTAEEFFKAVGNVIAS